MARGARHGFGAADHAHLRKRKSRMQAGRDACNSLLVKAVAACYWTESFTLSAERSSRANLKPASRVAPRPAFFSSART